MYFVERGANWKNYVGWMWEACKITWGQRWEDFSPDVFCFMAITEAALMLSSLGADFHCVPRQRGQSL